MPQSIVSPAILEIKTIGFPFLCSIDTALFDFDFDIYPIMQNGREIAHIHTDKGIYEVLGKNGEELYSAGDIVFVKSITDCFVVLQNDTNDTGKDFTLPIDQFLKDFIPAQNIAI